MTRKLKVRRIGTSCGVVLPREILDRLGVGEGDILFPVTTPTGVELTRYDPDFEKAVEAGRDFMRRYSSAMRKLAKG